jgi:hypothetical protein
MAASIDKARIKFMLINSARTGSGQPAGHITPGAKGHAAWRRSRAPG